MAITTIFIEFHCEVAFADQLSVFTPAPDNVFTQIFPNAIQFWLSVAVSGTTDS